jgi:DNA-binding MarR family transcriptional regulator
MKQARSTDEKCPESHEIRGSSSPAFLLAQVGSHGGIVRILEATPGLTQQALANALGSLPSRLVALVDELEAKGLLERQSDDWDRRRYSLRLTEKGMATLQSIGRIAREHLDVSYIGSESHKLTTWSDLNPRLLNGQYIHP